MRQEPQLDSLVASLAALAGGRTPSPTQDKLRGLTRMHLARIRGEVVLYEGRRLSVELEDQDALAGIRPAAHAGALRALEIWRVEWPDPIVDVSAGPSSAELLATLPWNSRKAAAADPDADTAGGEFTEWQLQTHRKIKKAWERCDRRTAQPGAQTGRRGDRGPQPQEPMAGPEEVTRSAPAPPAPATTGLPVRRYDVVAENRRGLKQPETGPRRPFPAPTSRLLDRVELMPKIDGAPLYQAHSEWRKLLFAPDPHGIRRYSSLTIVTLLEGDRAIDGNHPIYQGFPQNRLIYRPLPELSSTRNPEVRARIAELLWGLDAAMPEWRIEEALLEALHLVHQVGFDGLGGDPLSLLHDLQVACDEVQAGDSARALEISRAVAVRSGLRPPPARRERSR